MLKAHKKSAGNRNYIICILVLFAILFILVSIGFVKARYEYNKDSGGYIKAKEFYFTSEFLDGKEHTLTPGSTALSFYLANHADNLRYSEVAINYNVSIEPAAKIETGAEGTLGAGSIQNNEVKISGLVPGKIYVITATGTGGYKTALSATVKVPELENTVYKYLDTSNPDYVLLTVWSNGYQGDVIIEAPGSIIPDNTDSVMQSVKTGETIADTTSFKSSGFCSHTYRFFGSGVTAADFNVCYSSNISAEVKTPN